MSDRPALIAVSGGSDSVALLHWMINTFPDAQLHCATVDHGLRPESAQEAAQVAKIASRLGLPHRVLNWRPDGKATAADARQERYRLLHDHAREIGAGLIALGHTKNDQAETVLMRALRSRADSDTRGLSGMAEWASFHGIRLWRPLLGASRQDLRDGLQRDGIDWIDDPTNTDTSYERVRIRQKLADQADPSTPTIDQLARLAALSGQTRQWLNHQAADTIRRHVRLVRGSNLSFKPAPSLPHPLKLEVLACLVQVAGGQPFRPPTSKLASIADSLNTQQKTQFTLGRCLITARAGELTIQREQRDRSKSRRDQIPTLSAGALEVFRPCFDDSLYQAIAERLDSPCCST